MLTAMRNYFVKILLSFIGISYAMFVNAQDSIVGRILDEQEQGLDAAVVIGVFARQCLDRNYDNR